MLPCINPAGKPPERNMLLNLSKAFAGWKFLNWIFIYQLFFGGFNSLVVENINILKGH